MPLIDFIRNNILNSDGLERGFLPGDKGAIEWGRKHGVDRNEAKNRFHRGAKQGCQGQGGGKSTDDYGVNPDTGDIVDPEGDIIGNMDEERGN